MEYYLVLIFEVEEDGFYLEFGAGVDLEVCFGSGFAVICLEVLAYHDEGHQKYLYHIGQEEPEDECGIGIETHGCGGEHVPAEPGDGPYENKEKESHGAHVICDPHGDFIEPG